MQPPTQTHSAARPSMPRGTKRPAPDTTNNDDNNTISNAQKVDMLAALASVSTARQCMEQAEGVRDARRSSMSHTDDVRRQQQQQQQQQQKQQQKHSRTSTLSAQRNHHDYALKAYSLSSARSHSATPLSPQSTQLTLDPRTNLPPRDIIDELLSHVELEFNLISKVVHPKAFMAEYQQGKVGAFLLLTVMANNTMYSTHPAITSIGVVAAAKILIDRAKLFAPDAFENPTLADCQALLLLALAYMHHGLLSVVHFSVGATMKILDQLGVCKMDDSAWGSDDEWISGSSWLEREQIRRIIWGCFSIDTFLSMMLHKAPNVMIDLSGVNRPCAPTMWYIGNDNLETLSFPESAFKPNPNDTAYVAALKKIKMSGFACRINGNTVQLNFAVLGNAILRGISDPYYSQEHLDKLVVNAYKSLNAWVSEAPEMPDQPTFDEVQHTLLLCSAALCLKSVVAPYLITRGRSSSTGDATSLPSYGDTFDIVGDLTSPATIDRLLLDYIRTSLQYYRYMRLTADMIDNNSVPPMFLAHSTMIVGGIFAACAYAAPTQAYRERFARYREFIKGMLRESMRKSLLFRMSLEEIERVEEMVEYLPRKLSEAQLQTIRDVLVPESIEVVVSRRFSSFIEPVWQIARVPATSSSGGNLVDAVGASDEQQSCAFSRHLIGLSMSLFGTSKLSGSSLCSRMAGSALSASLSSIFGKAPAASQPASDLSSESSSVTADPVSAMTNSSPPHSSSRLPPNSGEPKKPRVPDYKLTFTAISSLLVELSVAAKDQSFFDYLFESADAECRRPVSSAAEKEKDSTPSGAAHEGSTYLVRSKDDQPLFSSASQTPATTTAWLMSTRDIEGVEGSRSVGPAGRRADSSVSVSLSPPFIASKSLSPNMLPKLSSTSSVSNNSNGAAPKEKSKHAKSINDLLN
ncbi:hypothetical protein LPJ53_002722 [Coemansia erecta]|uniref:Xylanolytic transcriptional activator regulatory domain-containing protein n=1 Tax=Coemansia erecta TaxID=147472 RepID=A0A9W8CTJ3_9FUNG|nr:hypothetical protein LPJ53_002722 [Coemansia erecta]